MLIRISLIVAIIAGLAVGTLNFVKVKKIIEETRAQRDDWHNKFTTTDAALTKTNDAAAIASRAVRVRRGSLPRHHNTICVSRRS